MSEPSREPRVSADGKFYWDGQRWVPMQAKSGASAREKLGMKGAWNSCVGYGCLIIALIFVIAAISAVCSGGK